MFSTKSVNSQIAGTEEALLAGLEALKERLGNRSGATSAKRAAAMGSPIALALVGAGLAYYAIKKKPTPDPRSETLARWEDEGGNVVDLDEVEAEVEDWIAQAKSAATAARRKALRLIRDGRETIEARTEVSAELAKDLAKAFKHGLADLSEDAQTKIADARKSAWSAMTKGKVFASDGLVQAETMIRRHPYMAAAVGAVLGAGIAAAFPRTRRVALRALPASAAAGGLLLKAAEMVIAERDRAERLAAKAGKAAGEAAEAVSEKVDEVADKAKQTAKRAANRANGSLHS